MAEGKAVFHANSVLDKASQKTRKLDNQNPLAQPPKHPKHDFGKSRGRPEFLTPAAQEILKEYEGRVTIRQLFYRLVSSGIIKNSETSYTTLINAMTKARRDGRIPFNAFEDRTRHSIEGELPNHTNENAESIVKDRIYIFENAKTIALRQLKQAYQQYSLPYWHHQPCYVEVWLEKEALVSLFAPIAEKYRVTLVPCKGYASLSLLYDCSLRLKTVPANREIRILYFGDYDVRGINIQETTEQNLLSDFGVHTKVIRIALTKEQIEQFQLPPNPAKIKDTMARSWIETHGNVAWELDALEPHVLTSVLENAIRSQINPDVQKERNRAEYETQSWIITEVEAYLERKGVDPEAL